MTHDNQVIINSLYEWLTGVITHIYLRLLWNWNKSLRVTADTSSYHYLLQYAT